MNKENFVERLYSHLQGSERFEVLKTNDLAWEVESDRCRISVIFDRHEESDPVVTVSPAADGAPKMSLFLLRHLRRVGKEFSATNSPEAIARILNLYFTDLLSGDFSIQSEYNAVSKRFFMLGFEVDMLPDTDPIKKKYLNFDIGWLTDLLRRKGLSL